VTARRPIAEKIMAVAGTFSALAGELEGHIELTDPRVQASLLDAATMLVMGSDTKDMGLLMTPPPSPFNGLGEDD
jgi:hypothetical protein